MEWIKIDRNNLPEGDVLAANFQQGKYGYKEKLIGYLSITQPGDMVICEDDHQMLQNCTHYIDLNKFDL